MSEYRELTREEREAVVERVAARVAANKELVLVNAAPAEKVKLTLRHTLEIAAKHQAVVTEERLYQAFVLLEQELELAAIIELLTAAEREHIKPAPERKALGVKATELPIH